jgi:hypothetical protein
MVACKKSTAQSSSSQRTIWVSDDDAEMEMDLRQASYVSIPGAYGERA